jgi:hypothetical protein
MQCSSHYGINGQRSSSSELSITPHKGPPLFKYETLWRGGEGCEIVLAHFCHFAQTAFVSDSLLSEHNQLAAGTLRTALRTD